MHLLVLNCGSSTIKLAAFSAEGAALEELARGSLDAAEGTNGASGAIAAALARLGRRPDVIAHRIVNGGSRYTHPTLIDDAFLAALEGLVDLAPLHNPPALAGIAACRGLGMPMVAVFDTAFHRTLPEAARRLPLPRALTERHELRRYGFHGISHQSVVERYVELTGRQRPTLVSLHLGGGASAAAIRDGLCVDTSMGMTPLEGLMMGTRAGDLDPGVILLLLRRGLPLDELDEILNERSGLLALAGTSDVRELERRSDAAAKLALEMFELRAAKYVGAYLAALGGAEAIVFTGGIGENAVALRRRVLERLAWAGVVLDPSRLGVREGRLTAEGSPLGAWVIPTREELLIARQALALVSGSQGTPG
jgi:acetate kinase